MSIKTYSTESLQYMNIFRKVTNISPKDYFEVNSELMFVVEKAKISAALGKEGKNIRRLRELLNKKIKVMGASKNAEDLAADFLYPIRLKNVSVADSVLNLEFNRSSERRFLLGNQQNKLKLLKTVVKRYHPEIADVRVL